MNENIKVVILSLAAILLSFLCALAAAKVESGLDVWFGIASCVTGVFGIVGFLIAISY